MIRGSIVLMVALAAATPALPSWARSAPTAVIAEGVAVREDGLVATWYPPASGRRGPVIVALGSSEGGAGGGRYLAQALAKQGFGVLALAYFGAEGLPKVLQEVPLEYFDRALAWVTRQPLADPKRVGIYGISVGGETALLVASRHPELRAVVAAVPSSVVWQGIDPSDYRAVKSTYALAGKPVAFLPYDNSVAFTAILDLYQRSLKQLDAHPDAVIPVERIGGDLLLLSARDDKLWPSTAMADAVIRRLDDHRFTHRREHIAYTDAGHGAMSPPSGDAAMRALDNLGGTPAGNQAARMDMWARVLAFFDRALGKR